MVFGSPPSLFLSWLTPLFSFGNTVEGNERNKDAYCFVTSSWGGVFDMNVVSDEDSNVLALSCSYFHEPQTDFLCECWWIKSLCVWLFWKRRRERMLFSLFFFSLLSQEHDCYSCNPVMTCVLPSLPYDLLSMSCWCFTFISATFCATMQFLTEMIFSLTFSLWNEKHIKR